MIEQLLKRITATRDVAECSHNVVASVAGRIDTETDLFSTKGVRVRVRQVKSDLEADARLHIPLWQLWPPLYPERWRMSRASGPLSRVPFSCHPFCSPRPWFTAAMILPTGWQL